MSSDRASLSDRSTCAGCEDEVDRLRAALEKIVAIPSVRLRGEGKDHRGEIVSVREAVEVAREALNGDDT